MNTITRRQALGRIGAGMVVPLVTGGVMPLLSACEAQAAPAAAARHALIVYYSRTGNTRAVAQHIQSLLTKMGSAQGNAGEKPSIALDLLEIQTVTPYPTEYRATTEQAKKELAEGYRPPLTTKVADMAKYELIFVGSPNWWSTVAPAVMTFLSEYDFSGKSIAPFITHGGGGLGHSVNDIRKLCPKATLLEAFAVNGKSAAGSHKDVAAWLRRLELGV